ncbi:MAG: hypothetical protein E7434_01905 [Ruminococcaceae bacterium]|nr:hypothetical protein [Oscillospiraceae bacterium]
MTYIKATWQEIENCGNEFGRCGNLLEQSNRTVRSAKRSLSLQIKLQTNYDDQLEALCTRMTALQQRMTLLKDTAVNVARMYRDTELRIRGEEIPSEVSGESSEHNWWDFLGGAGIFGEAMTGIADFFNSNDPLWVSVPSMIESALGIGEGIATIVENGGANWFDELFGFANSLPDNFDPNGNLFSQLLGSEIDGYIFDGSDGLASNLGVAAQWAGVITAGIGAAYDNWQELRSGEIDLGRAVGEFIIETGADIVIDAGAGMLVTATLVAACGSAPAILVGAGTVAVTWGLDWVSEQIFGVSATEAIADGVMNGVEWIGDQAASIGATISEGISDGAEWLGDRLDDAGDFFGDMFNGFGRDRARGGGGGHGFSLW